MNYDCAKTCYSLCLEQNLPTTSSTCNIINDKTEAWSNMQLLIVPSVRKYSSVRPPKITSGYMCGFLKTWGGKRKVARKGSPVH
jgi:hypothetical protein